MPYDLTKIKVVFADFDNTVCVHLNPHRDINLDTAWRNAMYTGNEDWYLEEDLYRVQDNVRAFLTMCKYCGASIYGLSQHESNIVYKAKRKFLDVKLPDVFDELYLTARRCDKVEFIKAWCSAFEISLSDVLMLDDHPETLYEARNAGINAISPITIATVYRGDGEL